MPVHMLVVSPSGLGHSQVGPLVAGNLVEFSVVHITLANSLYLEGGDLLVILVAHVAGNDHELVELLLVRSTQIAWDDSACREGPDLSGPWLRLIMGRVECGPFVGVAGHAAVYE
mmetsp:Transcript_19372/g.31890  ORF Transcript_19372/g.31890 Transcript_19372/m.31890 type:complete len:115 (+) Transcript_19372:378-722(+)